MSDLRKSPAVIPGPVSTAEVRHPRVCERIYAPRPSTEFKVRAYRLRKAIESEDIDAIKKAASDMTSDERLKALEKFEADDFRKSEALAKGYWDPEKKNYSAVHPRPEQKRAQAPAKPTGPTTLAGTGTSEKIRLEPGALIHWEHEGTIYHGKVKAWGCQGISAVAADGSEWGGAVPGCPRRCASQCPGGIRKPENASGRIGAPEGVGGGPEHIGLFAMDPPQREAYLRERDGA